jgi:hypothetical protein
MSGSALGLREAGLIALSAVISGVTATVIARRQQGGTTRPLSPCEKDCIGRHPDDTQARLNCMLKCIADGKVSFADVLAPL